MQTTALFQNVFKFCTFLPKFSIIFDLFLKNHTHMPLLSKIGPVSSFLLVLVRRYFLVALLRISSFSCSFQAFLFPAFKVQSSMVLWSMVNHYLLVLSLRYLIHVPLDYLVKTSPLPALLTKRHLEILYVGIQRFSSIFLAIPDV